MRGKPAEFVLVREPLHTGYFKISHLIHALQGICDDYLLRFDFDASLFSVHAQVKLHADDALRATYPRDKFQAEMQV
jgi:hypothetical protein